MAKAKRRPLMPYAYAVDQRDGHICDVEGCEEPLAFSILLRMKEDTVFDLDLGFCVPHFVALRDTVVKALGEAEGGA